MNDSDRLARYLDGELDTAPSQEFADIRRQLSSAAIWEEPPVELQEAIVGDLTRRYAPTTVPRARRRWVPRLAAAAGVLAAAVAVAVLVLPRDSAIRVQMVGTELAPNATALATIRSTPSGEDITLDISGLPPPPKGFFYQGWLRAGDKAVTIGTFHMLGGDDEVTLWAGVDINNFPVITVTLEPNDGDPASSGEVVLRGKVGQTP